jgi:hypothetical protein
MKANIKQQATIKRNASNNLSIWTLGNRAGGRAGGIQGGSFDGKDSRGHG